MLGKSGWAFSLDEGTLAFRLPHETLTLAVQLLGTESADDHTWLWVWGNTNSHIPARVMASAQELRLLGQTQAIDELSAPQFSLSPTTHSLHIAAVASGICRAACYFRVAYPDGILYMLIKDARYKRSVRRPLQRIVHLFPLFIRESAITNQRDAYLHYLSFYRLSVTQQDQRVTACQSNLSAGHSLVSTEDKDPLNIDVQQERRLQADFDLTGRLIVGSLQLL